jgi:hypothetical protein
MKPNAITISVGYSDLLAVTLHRNAKHFERILVVTDWRDADTFAVAMSVPNAEIFQTSAFYEGAGAVFRKWLALERGLDELGRTGWICVLDADILLPDNLDLRPCVPGFLYSPYRRMLIDPAGYRDDLAWDGLNRAPDGEFAGYFQLFHADDPLLGTEPWYQTEWKHAGGADSFFQAKWPRKRRIRLPYDVLHLGQDGVNWCGRTTPRLDGSIHPDAAARAKQLSDFIAGRRGGRNFEHEKVMT